MWMGPSLVLVAWAAAVATATASADYVLELGPAKAPLDASVYHNSSLWSWGGNVIEVANDPLWKYHLFVATFVDGCGLEYWESNSQVLHAVSNDPAGPFLYSDVAIQPWAHNPQVVRHTDGTYLLYTIGMDPETKPHNCNGEATVSATATSSLRRTHGRELMSLHISNSIYGPWSLYAANIFNGTNPSPVVNADGSVYVGSHTGSTFVVSTAPSWKGPYSDPIPLFGPSGDGYVFEDPFLWFDKPAQVWRVLLHQYNQSDTKHQFRVGGVASSANASLTSAWTLQSDSNPAFTTNVTFTDGSYQVYRRRERPKLLLDSSSGAPLMLYTGVCPATGDGNACYTVGQPVLGVK